MSLPPTAPAAPLVAAPKAGPQAPRWHMPAFVRGSIGLHAAAGAALLLPGGWPWALGAVVLNHAALTAAGLWPRGSLLGPNVSCLPQAAAKRGEIAITLDDGPDPEVTPAVLDLLAQSGQRVTFFCIAERARAQPLLMRRIVAAGHSVQNHSRHHRHSFSLLGPRALRREIAGAQDVLTDLCGVRPFCFRAPAGLRNAMLDPVLHDLGLHLVSWTRRGYDTRQSDPGVVLQRLGQGLGGGSILLLHDGHACRTALGQPVLLAVLPALLRLCQAQGLRPVTLKDALPPRRTGTQA